jgi:uncharacterized protein (TIGR03067 family)
MRDDWAMREDDWTRSAHHRWLRVGGGLIWWASVWWICGVWSQATAEDPPLSLVGRYRLLDGKVEGKGIDAAAKKADYSITPDTITISGQGVKFVIGYKLAGQAPPIAIDMVIVYGPEGTKGSKALGIVALEKNQLKLAYVWKGNRPTDFSAKEGMYFLLEKLP